ncbi:MAG: hypothetical protein ACRDSF_01990 [Pseudonocardiaceae bacterium]
MNGSEFDPLVAGAVVLVVLAGVGVLAAFGAGARAGHRATQHAREVTRIGGNLTRALAAGGVIVGVQWAVVANTTAPGAWGVVLGVPAVFAGSAIARMFAVTEIIHGGRRTRR